MLTKFLHVLTSQGCRYASAGVAALLLVTVGGTSAHAVGTEAGTTVSNTVTVDYAVGGVSQDQVSDSADFVVDRKIDVTVSAAGTEQVIPGETAEVLAYTVTNTGNGEQGFDIDVSEVASGLALTLGSAAMPDPGEYVVYVDANANGTFDAGTDTQYTPGSGTSNAFDLGHATNTTNYPESTTVFIVANIPSTEQDGDEQTFTVTATALDVGTDTVTTEDSTNNLGTEETIFVDGAGTADSATDGKHSNEGTYQVLTATLVVTKSMQVVAEAPSNCTTDSVVSNQFAIPGACVEYTITVTNNGSADAQSVSISDALPSELTFDGFHSSTSTFDTGPSESGGTVTATANTIAAGGDSRTLVIRALVD